MRILLALVRKEFLQVFRDRATVFQVFFIPVVQLLVLSNAATFEVRATRLLVVDEDRSAAAAGLVGRFAGSPEFAVVGAPAAGEAIEPALRRRDAQAVLRIPRGFAADVARGDATVQVQVSAQEGAASGIVLSSARAIVAAHARALAPARPAAATVRAGTLDLRGRAWFNPARDYRHYMVPGLLVSLVTIIGMLLTAQNITREKELGTLDQLNVTPVRRWQVIASKLLPFWILGLVTFTLGLLIGRLVFGVPVAGSLVLVYAAAVGYLLVALGLGLLLSTVTETQQQTMFVAFFVLVVFLLMSGLFTPIDGMPGWARAIADLTPVKHFVALMRGALLRGAGWPELGPTVAGLYFAGLAVCALAVARYRKAAG